MRSILNGYIRTNLIAAAVVVLITSVAAFGQYNEQQQITAVQQQVRTKVLRENSGFAEAVAFDNNAIVTPAEYGRMNRVTGSGRYRSNLSAWRVFNYEGLFNSRTGAVTNVMYDWSTDGGGNNRPPIGNGKITWAGRVDGTVRITIQRGRVNARETLTNTPIYEETSKVNQQLPQAAVDVTVDRRDGRGTVRVIQQPNRFNSFTAIIEVSDPQSGSDYYSLDIDWNGGFDNRPGQGNGKMTWSGRVDGTARITIQRGNITAREVQTRTPIYEESSNVVGQLPQAAVNVTVDRRDGRGNVRVVQQPNRFNNFTAIIEVSDPQTGSDYYSLDIDWEGGFGNRPPEGPGQGDRQMTWQGNVDDVIEIYVRDRTARYEVISGRNPSGVRFDFDGRLPRRNVDVSVTKLDGRGDVEVVRQPDRYNGYTAVVRITDRRGGSDNYRFELNWDRNAVDEESGDQSNLTWSGRVDDVVRLEIQGRNVRAYTISGQALQNDRFYFYESLPRRNVNVSVNRRDGRGDVRVIQQPGRNNNYTAVVEIRDTRGGADNYLLEINW